MSPANYDARELRLRVLTYNIREGDVEMDHAFVRHVAQLVGDLQSLHAAKGELDSAISNVIFFKSFSTLE